MKQLNYIGIICAMSLITAPAVADIASAEYVDSVVVKYSTGNTTKAGITKLYTGIGTNTDGTMTQSAINTALSNKQDKLPTGPSDGKKYSLIWNGNGFSFEEFTTGGGSTGLQCPADQYDIGFEQCIDLSIDAEDGYFEDPDTMTWGSYFTYGAIEGSALCSSTPKPSTGESFPVGDPDGSGTGDTKYCWCKMTSPSESPWVFNSDQGDAEMCGYNCPLGCADNLAYYVSYRSAMFSAVGN